MRSGEQPSTDPDVQDLLEAGDGYRVYRDGLQKKLVGGRWEISIT